MPLLLDTDIAIHLRDAHLPIVSRVAHIPDDIAISMPTLIELQAGLAVEEEIANRRRAGISELLQMYELLALDRQVAYTYGEITARIGFSRTRVFDRLIAATAIVHDLTLVTINGSDFRDIPGLKIEDWSLPAQ